MSAKLSQGPSQNPKIELRFSVREKEFIRLRYEEEKSLKEIAEILRCSLRTAKWYSEIIYIKLGIEGMGGESTRYSIVATKLLVKFGLVNI